MKITLGMNYLRKNFAELRKNVNFADIRLVG